MARKLKSFVHRHRDVELGRRLSMTTHLQVKHVLLVTTRLRSLVAAFIAASYLAPDFCIPALMVALSDAVF